MKPKEKSLSVPALKSFYFKALSVILISCLGIIVYSDSFRCSFHLDDRSSITENFSIRSIHNLQGIWHFWPCRFITYFSFAINYHFNELNLFGYHLFNVAVHLMTAIFVWWLTLLTLSTFTFKKGPVVKKPSPKSNQEENPITTHAGLIALFAGLIFVSHPLQTQAVTYIVQRAASLATLFYVASLCFYIQSRLLEDKESFLVLRIFCYICSLVTAIMAMFTKETAITLPLMILLYEFSFLRTKQGLNWKAFSPFLLTLLIIPVTILLSKSYNFQEMHRLGEDPTHIHPLQYLITQFRVMATYIRLIFLPLNQNVDYDYPFSQSFFELPVLLGLFFLAAILYCAKRLFSKYRLVSFSIFWFFLASLPESSIFPIKDVIFEHRLYLPLVGYSIFLVSGAYYLFGKNSIKMMVVALMMVVACNSVLTYQRNKVWVDEFTLWNDAVQKSPHKARPYNNRGVAYEKENNHVQAMFDFNKAIELDPSNAKGFNNRGGIYTKENKFTQAISDYNKAIAIDPNYAEAYNNRGVVYGKENKPAQALSDYNKAIELNPNYEKAYDNRGFIYYRQKNYTQAMSDYNKVLELNPKQEEAYDNLGAIYFNQGDYTRAKSDYDKAIELDPRYAEAYSNRGLIYYKQHNFTQALSDYNKAIEINPQYTDAYNNRIKIYVQQGKYTRAMPDFKKAIDLSPENAKEYIDRGNIYAQHGNFTQALSDYNKAIELKTNDADAYNNRSFIYINQGNLIQALSDCDTAIKINPDNAEAYNNRGLIYYKQGDLTQAILDLNKAIEINPGYADAYINRGNVYAKQNDSTQAVADYTKAIEIDPQKALAYNNRAISYYQLKEYGKSWEDVHKAENLGITINPVLINALKQVSGQDK